MCHHIVTISNPKSNSCLQPTDRAAPFSNRSHQSRQRHHFQTTNCSQIFSQNP
uniref:Uncharacterized protein n=1 Tax=Kalanchoe fedtschenkoi TaxID=63787 RepID=A0A7N0V567_KALFE